MFMQKHFHLFFTFLLLATSPPKLQAKSQWSSPSTTKKVQPIVTPTTTQTNPRINVTVTKPITTTTTTDLCKFGFGNCNPPPALVILCQQCSANKTPANSHCWEIPGQVDASTCNTADSDTYVVCGKDGKITATTKPCERGAHCTNGVCKLDKPPTTPSPGNSNTPPSSTNTSSGGSSNTPQQPTCTETQETATTPVSVSGTDESGKGFSVQDICFNGTSVGHYFCQADQSLGSTTVTCASNEICQNGICKSTTPPPSSSPPLSCICSHIGSSIQDKNCQQHADAICDQNISIKYTCGARGDIAVQSKTTCPSGCANGNCF